MKYGAIIESVYVRVKGGRLDASEVNVKRWDIIAYLPAAINFALREQYYLDKREENATGVLPSTFLATYEDVEVKENERRGLRYIDLPAAPVSVSNDLGVEVGPMKGDMMFAYMKNPYSLGGGYAALSGTTSYFLEGARVYFKDLDDSCGKVLVRMMESAPDSDVDMDKEAPIPFGLEPRVIDLLVQFVTGQRAIVQDNRVNATDEPVGRNG